METHKKYLLQACSITCHLLPPQFLRRRLLLLLEGGGFSLQHRQQGLRTLQDLHIRCFCFLDSLVELIACLHPTGELLVHLAQALSQLGEVLQKEE
jgi:hypothetical protein